MSFCETCRKKNGIAYGMKEPDARLHQDHNPGHQIVTADTEQTEETIRLRHEDGRL